MTLDKKDFYHKIRQKIVKWSQSQQASEHPWSKYILWAPDLFYLIWKLASDERVPKAERIKLLAVIAYFISPLDLIPEGLLGPVGYLDDIVLVALVLNGLINRSDPELVREYWPGDDDVLDVIKNIVSSADRMVGQRILNKLKRKL